MSDDDFMLEDNEEDFEFDYDDDDQNLDVDLENKYYNAKGIKENNPKEAMANLEEIVELEDPKGEWYVFIDPRTFKALKQSVKISFGCKMFSQTLTYYSKLLTFLNVVTKNYSEKSINNILDYISGCSDMAFLESFYQETINALKLMNNERLSTKTNLKCAKLYLDRKQFTRLTKLLKQLHVSCQNEDGSDDQKKGTVLLEIFALEIQMLTETKNNKKLKALYEQCLSIKAAIPHPKVMGIVRECGGKMHMRQSKLKLIIENWEKAQVDFFEAFRNYDEAGSPQRLQCLKYLVLANMLMDSEINPFESQETKPYKNDPEIVAMTDLVSSFQRKELDQFEKILKTNKNTIMQDPFIRDYIDEVLINIRSQVVTDLVQSYSQMTIASIAEVLNISVPETLELVTDLILNDRIKGLINQKLLVLELERYFSINNSSNKDDQMAEAITNLAESAKQFIENLENKIQICC